MRLKDGKSSRLYLLLCAGALALCLAALCVGLCLGGGEGTGNVPGSGVSYESVSPPDVDLDGVVEGLEKPEDLYNDYTLPYGEQMYQMPVALFAKWMDGADVKSWMSGHKRPTLIDFFEKFQITSEMVSAASEDNKDGRFDVQKMLLLPDGDEVFIRQAYVFPNAFLMDDVIYTLDWVLQADGPALRKAGLSVYLMEDRKPYYEQCHPEIYGQYLQAIERLRAAGGDVPDNRPEGPQGDIWSPSGRVSDRAVLHSMTILHFKLPTQEQLEAWYAHVSGIEKWDPYSFITFLGITRQQYEEVEKREGYMDLTRQEKDVLFSGSKTLFYQTFSAKDSIYIRGKVYPKYWIMMQTPAQLHEIGITAAMMEARKNKWAPDLYGNPSDWNPIIEELKRLEQKG